jgi:serine/threonine protein kinase
MSPSPPTQPLPVTDPLVGASLGEYVVVEPIGEGGMGIVYLGVQPVIKKRVAIKVLKPNAADDVSQVQRLIAEAEAVNSIGHRNIIDIFGLGQLPDGRHYVVMEYLEGDALDAYLERVGRLPLAEVVELLIAVCNPLGAAHRANVIHRDLKPSNIFLCRQADDDGARYLKLLDFGLAKRATNFDGTSAQTSHVAVGTPDFMAPEQARGLTISTRTDIYALGVMAYELLSGELPFKGQTPMDVIMKHVSSPVPSLAAVAPEAPADLVALVHRMLSKDPDARPQSIEEVRDVLVEIAKRFTPEVRFQSLSEISGRHPRAPLKRYVAPEGANRVSARTVVSPPAVHWGPEERSRWPLFALPAALAVVLFGAWWFGGEPSGSASTSAKPALPAAKTPVELATPDGTSPAKPKPGGDVRPVKPRPPEVAPPFVDKRKKPGGKTPVIPSLEVLRARVVALEAAIQQATPAGEEADPTALTLLRKYKVEAAMLSTEDDRLRLGRSLDQFERTFLQR